MWKTPVLPLKRFPPPSQIARFGGPLSVMQLLQQRVVNKLLGLDAQRNSCCVVCSDVCSAPYPKGSAGNYKSGAITQQHIWQEQCCTLFELQHSFTQCLFQWAWTMQARVCIVLQSRRLLLWTGAKLQKSPVQIRRDGFIIRLKCQLLQKTYPQATLTNRRFEVPIIPAKPLQSQSCKTIILALQNTHNQCWLSCWQGQG